MKNEARVNGQEWITAGEEQGGGGGVGGGQDFPQSIITLPF